MTSTPAAAPPSTQKLKTESRQAGLRQANLAILIVLIVQFALGMGVNLYVTLPAAGHPGHASWFGNGTLLALGLHRQAHRRLLHRDGAGLRGRAGLLRHRPVCRANRKSRWGRRSAAPIVRA
jgi:hypothetical protein